ncbi:amino acid transporter AVT1I-like [Impatiens glandulifera]|uniref:amino acid transporter AVT1I-like n=1 Tax=Impatiens glandulifera TaxID=253017 RepID=UPI001FB0EBEB|nr:amino acid transporter AVT1I-like [Impatiens glandulifera]
MDTIECQSHDALQQPKTGTTFLRTCFNGLNAMSGVGILSIPYALSQGGWMSLILLFMVAIICFYTALLLRRCMDANPLTNTYPDVGELAFGKKGRTIVSMFMYLELFLVAVEFLILQGDNLDKLFPGVSFIFAGKKLFVLLTALIIWPTLCLTNLGLLAYVSVGGVFASFIMVGSVFWSGAAADGVGFEEKGELWIWSSLPTAISLYTFCYCGHAVFPTLNNSMKDKIHFPKVLFVCFLISTVIYVSMAIEGYLMFGGSLVSQVTLNLPSQLMSSKIAIYTTLVGPITKYALVICPIATAIEDMFPFSRRKVITILIRTAILLITVVVAMAVPYFGYVMTFMGAFLGVGVSIVLPCLCYLKIHKDMKRFGLEYMIIVIILMMGIFVSIVGTYTSIRNIVMHLLSSSS